MPKISLTRAEKKAGLDLRDVFKDDRKLVTAAPRHEYTLDQLNEESDRLWMVRAVGSRLNGKQLRAPRLAYIEVKRWGDVQVTLMELFNGRRKIYTCRLKAWGLYRTPWQAIVAFGSNVKSSIKWLERELKEERANFAFYSRKPAIEILRQATKRAS